MDWREIRLAEEKDWIRRSVLAQTARITAEIDAYPDIAKVEDFRYLYHDQLRKFFDDEFKKWLT